MLSMFGVVRSGQTGRLVENVRQKSTKDHAFAIIITRGFEALL